MLFISKFFLWLKDIPRESSKSLSTYPFDKQNREIYLKSDLVELRARMMTISLIVLVLLQGYTGGGRFLLFWIIVIESQNGLGEKEPLKII